MPKPLDPFMYHEAVDRALIAAEAVDQWLVEHPAIKAHPRWHKQAEKARDALLSLHQSIAAHSDGKRR